MRNRVVVIGLDGATPELLFPWAKKGYLPNIAKLIETGVSGKLRSTIPPITAAAWVSFMTGKRPGKHGVVDFVQKKPWSYDIATFDRSEIEKKSGIDLSLANAVAIESKKIWDILGEHGKKVGVMHVPITYPPSKVNGFIITGLGTPGPNSKFTYPSNLREKILSNGYKIHITELDVEGNEDAALRDMRDTETKRCEIAVNLMKEYEDWDFFCIIFEATDFVQHFFWEHMDPRHHLHNPEKAKKYGNAILNCYQLLDEMIGKILENADDDTSVVIMSDHGGGPLNKLFYINKWLMNLELLKLKNQNNQRIPVRIGVDKEKIRESLIKLGLKNILKRIPKSIKNKIPDDAFTMSDFDWQQTKAYSFGGWSYIYINLRGREPEGIVSKEEYDAQRDYIINELYKLKDPDTGENIVQTVFKKEDLYGTQAPDQLPDIIIMMDESIDCKHSIPKGNSVLLPSSINKSGNHRKDGIFIIKGQNICANIDSINAEIIDIAPTILYILGVPIPPDMDGKVIECAFNSGFVRLNS
jgi:predicted AlkP superfamily phosphohydrolase/phosphomutase